MAKAKIIYSYLLCFLVCSSLAGQDYLSKREELQQIYQSQVGVREQGGANRGEQVEQYLASVGFGPGYAWCAAFVSWCYQQVDVEHPQSAWVPSYAIKENLIPNKVTKIQFNNIYASEADVLNIALFGMTAKEWREKNPGKKGNIRDYANVSQLVCLSNMENLNALFINEGMAQKERLIKLNAIAIQQMKLLTDDHSIRKLEEGK